jgi:hypothetical protein
MGDDGEEMFVILRGGRIVLPGVSGEEVVAELQRSLVWRR